MKIQPSIYAAIKADIQTIADKTGIRPQPGENLRTMFDLLAVVSQNRAFDDTHPFFASGRWPRLLPYDGREYCFYYAGGVNDSHVETALRKIKKEIFGE